MLSAKGDVRRGRRHRRSTDQARRRGRGRKAAGAVSEAKILRQEKTTMSSQLEARRHQCELLQQAAYLSREVESARERERRWEEEEDRLREKTRALRAQADDLREKLANWSRRVVRQTRADARGRDRATPNQGPRGPRTAAGGARGGEGPGDSRAEGPAGRRGGGRDRRCRREPSATFARVTTIWLASHRASMKNGRRPRRSRGAAPNEVDGARARDDAPRRGDERRQGAQDRVRHAGRKRGCRVAVPFAGIARRTGRGPSRT